MKRTRTPMPDEQKFQLAYARHRLKVLRPAPEAITIRVYPEPRSRLYARVLVFRSRAAMYRYLPLDRNHAGACTDVIVWNVPDEGGRIRRHRCFAEVKFYRGRIGMELVSHELFHATMAFGRRLKFQWSRLGDDDCVNDDEERLAHAHGRMCAEFVAKAERHRLYDERGNQL